MNDRIINTKTINADNCQDAFSYQCGICNLPTVLPSYCPCCKRALNIDIKPIVSVNNINTTYNSSNPSGYKEYPGFDPSDCEHISIYQCGSCKKLFIIKNKNTFDNGEFDASIMSIFPNYNSCAEFSKDINELSPEFVKIYNQAELAENYGLNQICGMGYRRALEFLVDAYARKCHPNQNIDASSKLSYKIENYIDDTRIKVLAEKTSWLGNDETHIVNFHPERDVEDMKKFIRAMTTMIDSNFAFEDANTIEKGKY